MPKDVYMRDRLADLQRRINALSVTMTAFRRQPERHRATLSPSRYDFDDVKDDLSAETLFHDKGSCESPMDFGFSPLFDSYEESEGLTTEISFQAMGSLESPPIHFDFTPMFDDYEDHGVESDLHLCFDVYPDEEVFQQQVPLLDDSLPSTYFDTSPVFDIYETGDSDNEYDDCELHVFSECEVVIEIVKEISEFVTNTSVKPISVKNLPPLPLQPSFIENGILKRPITFPKIHELGLKLASLEHHTLFGKLDTSKQVKNAHQMFDEMTKQQALWYSPPILSFDPGVYIKLDTLLPMSGYLLTDDIEFDFLHIFDVSVDLIILCEELVGEAESTPIVFGKTTFLILKKQIVNDFSLPNVNLVAHPALCVFSMSSNITISSENCEEEDKEGTSIYMGVTVKIMSMTVPGACHFYYEDMVKVLLRKLTFLEQQMLMSHADFDPGLRSVSSPLEIYDLSISFPVYADQQLVCSLGELCHSYGELSREGLAREILILCPLVKSSYDEDQTIYSSIWFLFLELTSVYKTEENMPTPIKIRGRILTKKAGADVSILGQFGVGFYSAFQVATETNIEVYYLFLCLVSGGGDDTTIKVREAATVDKEMQSWLYDSETPLFDYESPKISCTAISYNTATHSVGSACEDGSHITLVPETSEWLIAWLRGVDVWIMMFSFLTNTARVVTVNAGPVGYGHTRLVFVEMLARHEDHYFGFGINAYTTLIANAFWLSIHVLTLGLLVYGST